MLPSLVIGLILSYLIGSIPTAVWVGRTFYDIDVREHGSGNAGATNTFRVLGKKAGIPVLLFDVLKGYIGVNLACYFGIYEAGSTQFINYQIILGIAVLLGHIFPIYVGFRGGKGIATLLGIILALHTLGALVCFVLFVVLLLITKIVSLSSMLSSIAFPFVLYFGFKEDSKSLIFFAVVIAILVVLTHHKNVGRLLKGEEAKASFLTKKNKEDTSEDEE
jgi:glycerol-3-phosphate acyltransferase PlsY